MTIIFYPDGTRVHQPSNEFQKNDHETWLGSVTPGHVASGPLNPVLYP
jgi:hypothetical protein